MKYEVSYVEHGRQEAKDLFELKLALGRLDEPGALLVSFEATRHDEPFRVSYRRKWTTVFSARSEMEALRTFLHIRGLPDGLNFRDIVIKQVENEVPIESDDQRAGAAA